jgi:hypothetical protein
MAMPPAAVREMAVNIHKRLRVRRRWRAYGLNGSGLSSDPENLRSKACLSERERARAVNVLRIAQAMCPSPKGGKR